MGVVTLATALIMTACLRPPAAGSDGAQPRTRTNPIVRVAAASDLKFAMDAIQRQLREQAIPIDLEISYGSSGNFFAQISNGAPFDVFLSADRFYVDRLVDAGLARPADMFGYARGRLAVWSGGPHAGRIERDGITALADPAFGKISIANPDHAPYGVAAIAALEYYGLLGQVRHRLVFGENVAQAAEFALSGAADASVIALALARSDELMLSGRSAAVSDASHPPLEQFGVVLDRARNPGAARDLAKRMTGPEIQAILARFGFDPPSHGANSDPPPSSHPVVNGAPGIFSAGSPRAG